MVAISAFNSALVQAVSVMREMMSSRVIPEAWETAPVATEESLGRLGRAGKAVEVLAEK